MITEVSEGGVHLRVEPWGDGKKIIVAVHDQQQLLGRLIIDEFTVSVLQPNRFDGPTVEWVGLPRTSSDELGA